jgi:hypothetical protein
MNSYLEIDRLFGTPLANVSTPNNWTAGKILLYTLVTGFAVYGVYKFYQLQPTVFSQIKKVE